MTDIITNNFVGFSTLHFGQWIMSLSGQLQSGVRPTINTDPSFAVMNAKTDTFSGEVTFGSNFLDFTPKNLMWQDFNYLSFASPSVSDSIVAALDMRSFNFNDLKSFTSKDQVLEFVFGYADTIRGSGKNDELYGFAGADFIDGKSGADIICGGKGRDTLSGDKYLGKNTNGHDTFLFNVAAGRADADEITDFDTSEDVFNLDHRFFKGLDIGTLKAYQFKDFFHDGKIDANDRIITDSTSVYFDRDGSGTRYDRQLIFSSYNDFDRTDFVIV